MNKEKTKSISPKNGIQSGNIRLGLTGIVFSFTLLFVIHLNEQKKASNELNNISEDINNRIASRLYLHRQLLKTTSAFFQASDSVELESWNTFISYSELIGNLPGTRSIGYISVVNDSTTTISYIKPEDRNQKMIGINMFIEPVRKKAMQIARDSNEVIITGKIRLNLLSDTSTQYGILMFAPVYKNKAPLVTVSERRNAIKGWIFNPFGMDNFIMSIISSKEIFEKPGIDFTIYDNEISDESLLFQSNDKVGPDKERKYSKTVITPLDFYGHTWILQFNHTRSFYHLSILEIIVLIFGTIISLLLYGLERSVKNTNSRALAIAEDLTKELKESEEKFRTVVQTLPSLLTITDKKGEIVFISANSESFTGHKPGLIPSSALFWVHEDDIKTIPNFVAEPDLAGQKVRSFKYKAVKKNGEIWYAHTSWAFQEDSNGIFNGIVFQTVDITEIEQAENALIESEKKLKQINATKDKFFSIIAHDLRSPFNAILGFTVLIEEHLKNNNTDKAIKLTKMINENSEQTLVMLENLLDWSTTQTEDMSFNPEYYFVNPLIQRVLGVMNTSASVKNITINCYSNESENMFIFVDMNMFEIILRNLISNAIKFTNPGGRIDITTWMINDKIEISIEDNGIGMDHELIDKLFRQETGISMAGTAHEKGSGLGLKLCRELIERNQGKLNIQSQVGRGSKFTFTMLGKNFNELN